MPQFLAGSKGLVLAAWLTWIPLFIGVSAHAQASAQQSEPGSEAASAAAPVIPQQVRYAGKLSSHAGETVEAVFRIYAAAQDGEPLWTEKQGITVGEDGSYSVLLGSSDLSGLPQTVFADGAARWLGVSVDGAPQSDRVLLASVPYAMKSADAEALAGRPAADFVTKEELAALTAAIPAQTAPAASPSPATVPPTSGTVTGSGTAGNIPMWTGALTQGNSEMVQMGSDIGINETAPAATLDVGGTETVRGTLTLPALETATTSEGWYSQIMQLSTSAWSTATNAAIAPTFQMFAYPVGNDTATPSATFYLRYKLGTTYLNLLSIASNGVVDFASAQTFPGTIKSVAATSPVTAATTAGAVTVGLNIPTLETTLNSVYAQLGTANAFAGNQSIAGGLTVTGALSGASSAVTGLASAGGFLSNGAVTLEPEIVASGTAGVNSPVLELDASAYNNGTSAAVAQNFAWQTQATGSNTASPSANLALLYGSGATAPAATGLSISPNGNINFASGQTFPNTGAGTITGITTSSPLTGSGTSGSVALGLNVSTLENTLNGVYAGLGAGSNAFTGSATFAGPITGASSGPGGAIAGGSMSGPGIIGNSQSPAEGAAGILGYINTSPSASYTTLEAVGTAGVWGDANGAPGGADWGAGIVGTASSDTGYGGVFYNNSAIKPTVWGYNASSVANNTGIKTGGGGGVIGSSTNASGVTGNSTTPVSGEAGVFGFTSSAPSSNYGTAAASSNLVGGVWGEPKGSPDAGWAAAGVVGTASATLGYGG